MQDSAWENGSNADHSRRAGNPAARTTIGSKAARVRSPVHELNLQCIELLVRAAWEDKPDLPLARQLQSRLRNTSQEARMQAAQRPFLLVDLEFTSRGWWELASKHPARTPSSNRPGHFPKAAAIQLGRAAITLLRHSLHSDGQETVLLGAHPTVLDILQSVSPVEIERMLERCFRDVRPRWEDRPALWNMLLQAAASGDIRVMRNFNLKGLHLLAGEML